MALVNLPEPFNSIPKQDFLFGPSPIQPLPRISSALGGKVNVYAKREDCNSGLAYGGNKTRKLEYLAAEALAQGCDTLVSIGGIQSNHTRQVSAVAARLGLKAATVQEHWVDWQDPGYETVGNIQLSRLMGADVRLDPSTFGIEHKTTLARLRAEIESAGGTAVEREGDGREDDGRGGNVVSLLEAQIGELNQKIDKLTVDKKITHVEGQHVSADFLGKHSSSVLFIYADANTIRDCPSCKAKFSDNFNIPEVWWTEYLRKGNGYFGSQNVLDDAEKVTGYVTWAFFKTKQVPPRKEKDYNWTKINIFTQWLKSGRRVVLSFAQRKGTRDTQLRICDALLKSLVARELTDPFWAYHRLLSFVLCLNDTSIWMITNYVRLIEKSDSHITSPPDYRHLHNLARHAIHIAEVLSVTCETIQHIKVRHSAWMAAFCSQEERLSWRGAPSMM
ncbi:hypothetical protein NQ176_g4005 [Zarea fungicola]|uniref:Uncharacterized protein n=1 Tax=Zarea fungicola TaxID=93591 RepID=A0ACC1NHM3_9HYPO|nr:hypothetical protein NQ176_g4005 [Lecanicillium fungicola]